MGRYHEERAVAPYQPPTQNEIVIESARPAERPRARRGMDWRMMAVMMVGMLVMLALLPHMKTIGWICFGLFCLGALWLVLRGILHLSRNVYETMERHEDLVTKRLQNEERRLLNQRYREALIQKDGERVMGVWARPDDPRGAFVPLYDPDSYHFHQGRAQQPAPVTVQELPPGPALPEREDIAAYLPRINAKHMLLGWRLVGGVSKAIWVSIELLLSCVIVGPPGSGKSSLLRFVCAEAILASAQVVIHDNHGSVARALKNARSYALGDRLLLADPASLNGWRVSDRLVFNFQSADEIEQSMADLLFLLDTRLEEYRTEQQSAWRPLLVLVDEWPQQFLMFYKSKARLDFMLNGLQRLICEGRKVAIYVLLSGQSLPARLLGDDTLIKQNCPNKIALHAEALQAQMIGIAQKEYQPFLDTLAQVFGEELNDPNHDAAAGYGMLKVGATKGQATAFPYCNEPLLVSVIQDVWQRQPPPALFAPEMPVLSESLYPQVAPSPTAPTVPTGNNDPTDKNPMYSAGWYSEPRQAGSSGSEQEAAEMGSILPSLLSPSPDLPSLEPLQLPPLPMKKGREEKKKKARCTPEERAEILSWHQAGYAPSAIASEMGKGSNFYYVVRDVLDEEAAKVSQSEDA